MRLIDAEARLKEVETAKRMWFGSGEAKAHYIEKLECAEIWIANAPEIDAVPVVRCKDCVCCSGWNDQLICSRVSGVMDGYYHGTAEVVNPDDYCSHGKRQRAMPLDAKTDGT